MEDIHLYVYRRFSMIYIIDDNIDEVTAHNNYVLIDFWAQWCGPCRALSPFIDKLEKEFPHITFCKANVEEAEKISERLGVQNLPCVIFYDHGKEVNRVIGNNQIRIREIIESL